MTILSDLTTTQWLAAATISTLIGTAVGTYITYLWMKHKGLLMTDNIIYEFSICPECSSRDTRIRSVNALCMLHYCRACGIYFDVATQGSPDILRTAIQSYRIFPED